VPRATLAAALAAAVLAGIGCAGAPAATPAAPACAGLVAPKLVAAGPVNLPPMYTAARVASDVLEEIVVERDGKVRQTKLVAAFAAPLVPFAQVSLEKATFAPASIDGHPVAVRGQITVPIGVGRAKPKDWRYDTLRAFVPAGSREALWQLAGSVDRLTLVAHVGTDVASGASIVAIAPGGAEKTLLAIPGSAGPLEILQTVRTGRFLSDAGDYRLELRTVSGTLAATTVTIAAGFETAIVNACEPLPGPEKTGPGH